MENNSSDKNFRIIPPRESPCIWMSAGILSYKLCDRKYECDTCPIDIALRKESQDFQKHKKNSEDIKLRSQKTLNFDNLYSSNHYWAKKINDNHYRIGLEPLLAKILIKIRGIALPSVGQYITTGSPVGWILFAAGTLPIYSPIAGRITLTNTNLLTNPHYIQNSPENSGWLYEIIPAPDFSTDKYLLTPEEAEECYLHDFQIFKDTLTISLGKNLAEVGPTLMDGGKPLDEIMNILEQEKLLEAIKSIFLIKNRQP